MTTDKSRGQLALEGFLEDDHATKPDIAYADPILQAKWLAWQARAMFDELVGDFPEIAGPKGRVYPRLMNLPVDTPEAKLNRALISHEDIGEAQQYLQVFEKLDSTSDAVMRRALLTAAVVAYSRPFTRNYGHTRAARQLDVNLTHWFTAAQLAMHQKVLDLRDTAVAHSDYSAKPASRVTGNLAGFSFWGSRFDLLQQQLDVPEWLRMCNQLVAHCFQSALGHNRDMECLRDPSLAALIAHIPKSTPD
jgi:hypothetical protein